jgi:two-component system sensor histidine kinase DesK
MSWQHWLTFDGLAVRVATGSARRAGARGNVVVVRSDARLDGLIRLASIGAVVAGVGYALVGLIVNIARESDYLPLATGATVGVLALHVRHLRYALAGARPPAAGWALAAMAVLIIGPTPLIGASWLQMFHLLAASSFLVLRLPWAVAAYVGTAFAAALWSLTIDWPGSPAGWAAWNGLSVIIRGFAPIVLVWLVVALRQLDSARRALATDAVEMERRRIADELQHAVGRELETLVATGVQASELLTPTPAAAERELQRLVARSRETLADARRLLHQYALPARVELDSAMALLHAAGVDAALEVRDGALPGMLDETSRAALRELTNELLHDEYAGRVTVRVVRDDGVRRLEHRTDRASAAPAEPVA